MLAAKQGLDVVCRAVVGSGSRPGAVLDVAPGAGAVDVSIAEGVSLLSAACVPLWGRMLTRGRSSGGSQPSSCPERSLRAQRLARCGFPRRFQA